MINSKKKPKIIMQFPQKKIQQQILQTRIGNTVFKVIDGIITISQTVNLAFGRVFAFFKGDYSQKNIQDIDYGVAVLGDENFTGIYIIKLIRYIIKKNMRLIDLYNRKYDLNTSVVLLTLFIFSVSLKPATFLPLLFIFGVYVI